MVTAPTATSSTSSSDPITRGTSQIPRHIIAAIFGDSGVGKTRSFLTLTAPTLFINTEAQGLISLPGYTQMVWDARKDTRGVSESLRHAWNYANTHPEIQHVVIDSLVEAQQEGLDVVAGGSDKDTDQRDFGKNFRQIRSLIKAFLMLPQHLWFVAGERGRDDESGTEILQPDLPPAILRFFKRQCTLGLRFTSERVFDQKLKEVRIVTNAKSYHDGRSWGLDRSGNLPKMIPNPNLDQIVALYLKGTQNG